MKISEAFFNTSGCEKLWILDWCREIYFMNCPIVFHGEENKANLGLGLFLGFYI